MKFTALKLAKDLENKFLSGPVEKLLVKLSVLSEAELREIYHDAERLGREGSAVLKVFAFAVAGSAKAILQDKFHVEIEDEKSLTE